MPDDVISQTEECPHSETSIACGRIGVGVEIVIWPSMVSFGRKTLSSGLDKCRVSEGSTGESFLCNME